jgi:hypothetical protein
VTKRAKRPAARSNKRKPRRGKARARRAARPRTFEEVVGANLRDPFHARIARLNSGERFDDPRVSDPFQREVSVDPDCEGGSHWLVEYDFLQSRIAGCVNRAFEKPTGSIAVSCSLPTTRVATCDARKPTCLAAHRTTACITGCNSGCRERAGATESTIGNELTV